MIDSLRTISINLTETENLPKLKKLPESNSNILFQTTLVTLSEPGKLLANDCANKLEGVLMAKLLTQQGYY